MHETPLKAPLTRTKFGGSRIQVSALPSQRSASGATEFWPPAVPTTMHEVIAVQETAEREAVSAGRDGVEIGVHADPDHCSAKAAVVGSPCDPTARHQSSTHDTPVNAFAPALHVPGTVAIDHSMPFQISDIGIEGSAESAGSVPLDPTATHSVVDTQSTDSRRTLVEPTGFGVGKADHVVPFQISAKDSVGVELSPPNHPTAMHQAAPTQLTSLSWLSVASAG